VTRTLLTLTLAALLALPLLSALPAPAPAQQEAPPPAAEDAAAATGQEGAAPTAAEELGPLAEFTPEQIEGFIATLEDEQARAQLVEQLRLIAALQAQARGGTLIEEVGVGLLSYLSAELRGMSDQLLAVGDVLDDLPDVADWAEQQVASAQARDRWLEILRHGAIVIGAGVVAFWLAWLVLLGPRRRLMQNHRASVVERLPLALARLALELLPVAAFVAVAYGAFGLVDPPRTEVRIVTLALINAIGIVTAVRAVARVLLAPRAAGLRIFPLTDRTARHLSRWVRRLINTSIVGFIIAETAFALGLPYALRNGLLALVGLIVAGMLIYLVVRYRRPVRRMIRGEGGLRPLAMGRRQLGNVWHILAVVYILALYVIWVLAVEGGFTLMLMATVWTVLIVVAARLLTLAVGQYLPVVFAPEREPTYPELNRRMARYQPIVETVLTALIAVLAVLGILAVWGIPAFAWLGHDTGNALLGALVTIALVIIVSVVAWEVINLLVERRLAQAESEGVPVEQRQRVQTLLPLLRNATLIVLLVVGTLMVLSEIGINIAPLLAGAGVVGLAIGFGAQTLVHDVITGLFMLFENTIAVGDVAQVGSHGGLVEGLTIRTVRLRDLSGNVHTVPFSQVTSVMNMTKDYSYYLFDIGVAYREDTDQVVEVVQAISAEMMQEEPYKAEILEPIEILGVDSFQSSAVVIKARIKTRPIKQWMVGREFNRRMKKRFDALGIEIPFPHMTLYFGQDKQGHAPPANLQVAAPALVEALASGGTMAAARRSRAGGHQPAGAAAAGVGDAVAGPAAEGDAEAVESEEAAEPGRPPRSRRTARRHQASGVEQPSAVPPGDEAAESSTGMDED